MNNKFSERRKYPRFDTELAIYFEVKYDLKTRIEFEVVERGKADEVAQRYFGLCKNVSAEGLCFSSKKKLQRGDVLLIEVFEPIVVKPIRMEGQVRWSKKINGGGEEKDSFRTGVRLISVDGKPVSDSICFDKRYKVIWSNVLESLFGTFAAIKK